ncbi:hypothetical protein OV203_13130 [Nannocystis sp. ILAH1]|uniref:hypothetical protein n=1 Tax=unclassified Nannocystis TaxID=2627009 RepID=UPI00227120A6|nr:MULTISPECIES: hypothetical protein [unclassified Nannocystis]MCY0988074.1 hypothetical protein [Nannocystis sp. ILAH1]MCY1065544.1 hypothetical protein [Nannocystis sp. RBIL2]
MRASPLAISLLAAAACGTEEPESCLLRSASSCDVREVDCQEHAHAVIACIRGTDHPLPQIEVMTADEYADANPPAPPRTPAEQRLWDQHVRAYALLNLWPSKWKEPAPTPVVAPHIAYDATSDTIIVVADRTRRDTELYGLLYALALADRDRESDLSGLLLTEGGTFDSKSGLSALFAGEATLFAGMAGARELDYGELAERFSYLEAMDGVREKFADRSATWGEAMSLFQYIYGAHYVLSAFQRGGMGAVDALYEDFPTSTAYALASGNSIDAAFSAIDLALPAPPEGFRYLSQDSLGPVMLQIHRTRETGDENTRAVEQSLARSWVGDRLLVAGSDTSDTVAVVWQIAGPGGEVAETIVRATDIATWDAFEALFPG